MDIISIMESRYSTKEFDKTKKLTQEQIGKLEDLLQLSPSSTNIQPWHFIIASTDEGKKRITKATKGFFEFNESKVLDSAVTVVFASKVDLTEEYLSYVLEKEAQDGRFANEELKQQNHGARSIFANMHKFDYRDFTHWSEKQVYLNAGNFLLGVAALGLDAIAMEGIDLKAIDEEFNLRQKGFTTSLVISVGYHKDTDYNKNIPKSRLDKKDIIEIV